MGKTSNWIRNLLTGKKDRQKEKGKTERNQIQTSSKASENPTRSVSIPSATPKEKRRWSFRRSSAASPAQKEVGSTTTDSTATTPTRGREAVILDVEEEQKKYALAVAAATATAADAAVAAAHAAAAVIHITSTASGRSSPLEDAAAIKIQSIFRAYLARKALNALKGLVKLQALVRGHLVRKQATATLRCMQALITAQARARVQRLRISEDAKSSNHMQMPQTHRKSTQDNRFRHSYHDVDRHLEENLKIVEMDIGESIGSIKDRSSSYSNNGQSEQRYSTYSAPHNQYSKQEYEQHISPAPSTITDMSPRACSGHFEDYSLGAEQSSPQCHSAFSRPDPSRLPLSCSDCMFYEYPLYRNYMANTESSRAKARSQSAPKSRPDSFERPPSRRRPSIEGRNVPRAVRMQRSSSHVGSTAQNYNYLWSMKLDRSTVSLKDSECGSSSTVHTNANYCRSLVGFNVHGSNY